MITPTFPKTYTLTACALARLLEGQSFTHRDFQNETASYRLSEYIRQLRTRHNWPIETKEETAKTKDPTGRVAVFGRYRLDPLILREIHAKLGERMDNFIEAVKRFESGRLSDTGK